MADDMANNEPVVTVATTLNVIAGLDPAIHHFKNVLTKIDGYAGQARV
jgi:hypothetical protein